MAKFRTPGVYVKEISSFSPSISAVETVVPAFIGYTEKTLIGTENRLFTPTRVNSMAEFIEYFGGPNPEDFIIGLEDNLDSNDRLLKRNISVTLPSISSYKLFYSLQLYFNNGGGTCYVVSVGDYSVPVTAPANNNSGLTRGIMETEKVDEITLILFPDGISLTSVHEYGSVVQTALNLCDTLKDRFTISDVYGSDITVFRSAVGNNSLQYGAVYYPHLTSVLNYGYEESNLKIETHTENGSEATVNPLKGIELIALKSTNPTLYAAIISSIHKYYVEVPPSGAIAGIYAQVDKKRGVWKAPANVSLNSVIEPVIDITSNQQKTMNVDSVSGKSINAIRKFAGRGTLVWGARTLAGNDNEWRYIPVCRFFMMVEESVKKSTSWTVFEPNDANTWTKIRAMIENFLTIQWQAGALAGAMASDAFFVKTGLGQTMTSIDILEGRMIIEIGMAVVRPAEFIILRIVHMMANA